MGTQHQRRGTEAKVNADRKRVPLFCLTPVYNSVLEESTVSILYHDDGGSMFSQNLVTARHSYLLPYQPQISEMRILQRTHVSVL
jgi:hypothetical protein